MQPASGEPISLLYPHGYRRSSCGYCNSKPRCTRQDTFCATISFSSSKLLPSQYQSLVDRGWRRSGTYYYKPDVPNQCCSHYAIRLEAPAFKPSKDSKQAINRWNRYIIGPGYVHLAARLCPESREVKRRRKTTFDLSHKVHRSEYGNIERPTDPSTKHAIAPAHRFEVTLEPDRFTEEKFLLFADYQKAVHHESDNDISRASFKRFLCSGLGQSERDLDGRTKKLGSYHQCYRLDGKLVAMGVLDLLPHCVSSVYLIYHQDVHAWNLGKLSALREIDLAVEGGYGYYYMGYYIHSCAKMRYKGNYRPSFILDPESYRWDPLHEDVFARLELRKYVSMAAERQLQLDAVSLPSPADAIFRDQISNNDEGTGSSDITSNSFENSTALLNYIHAQDPEWNATARSVFEAKTPGALTLEEVERDVELGKWKLKLRGYPGLIHLQDLPSWDEEETTDPSTFKGVAAELAAVIGADLVKQTALIY